MRGEAAPRPDLGGIAWGTVSIAAWAGLLYGSTAGMAVAMARRGGSAAAGGVLAPAGVWLTKRTRSA